MNKDKRWMIQNDPGILRKKGDAETDLFVFGYACKIFRDDQKALEMDQGKHLIPWMGDETLKIDRYDARGHLSEVSQFEGTNRDYVLTSEEKRIEQLCDEERYRALHHNEEEQEMYQEEELKRLKQALNSDKEYRQVAYQYETDGAPAPSSEPEVNTEDEEPFTPSPSLCIPANMKLPSTVKENQIIEKTAAHIASHGPQVEILIKTRQANNQKLNFLHVGSPLNPYYNFILSQIKTGRYKPAFMIQQEAESREEEDHYLHPSLAPAPSTVESAPSIPSIAYKPSSDCSYNLLVNKIRNMQQSQVEAAEVEEPSTSAGSTLSRRKRRKRHSTPVQPTTSTHKQITVPPQHVKEIISRLLNFAHSRDMHPSEIEANLLKQDSKNLGFVDPGHKYHDYYVQQLQETYKENIYNLSNPSIESVDTEEINSFNIVNDTYDPERPTEEEHSVSATGDSSLLQGPAVSSLAENDETISTSEYDVPNQPPSKPAPVCFSIKKPKETERLEHMSVFPLEESSSDGEGKEEEDAAQVVDVEKEKPAEGDKIVTSSLHSEEFIKTPGKSLKEKEQTLKSNKLSNGPTSPSEVIVISSQTSSDSGRKSISSSDSRRTTSGESSKKSSSSTSQESRKSPEVVSSDSKRLSSSGKRKSASSSERRKSLTNESSRKSTTPSESRRKRIKCSESSSRKSRDSGFYRSLRDSDRKSKDKKLHRKHKSTSSSPDKYRDRDRESKTMDEKMFIKMRRGSDDLPPLPDDLIGSPVPEENLEKKREERKKKAKQMIEKLKTESLGLTSGLQENNLGVLKTGISPISNGLSIKINKKTDESKTELQKDFEEQLREQVKQSLKKIAETTLASIPPITEDSCSQFDNSSAANSNGFETPSSCGRPMYRVSRTPSVGFMEGVLLEHSSSRSSSTVSRKSHKKKKHHKKKKKHKSRKSKKHHESSSESSWEDDELWASSSESEPRPKKRHKSSKRHKRHKRKHRRQPSSSSSSSSD